MSVLPDFGYGIDNYLLDKNHNSQNNWLFLSKIMENPEKFGWLMNYMKLKKIKKEAKITEQLNIKAQQLATENSKKKFNSHLHHDMGPALKSKEQIKHKFSEID